MSNWAFYYGCFSVTVNEQKTIIWIYICVNVYIKDISDREKNIIEINDNFGKNGILYYFCFTSFHDDFLFLLFSFMSTRIYSDTHQTFSRSFWLKYQESKSSDLVSQICEKTKSH